MRWWLRARADAGALLLLALGLVLVPVIAHIPMPVLRVGDGEAPFYVILPALAAAGVVGLLRRGEPALEALAVRRVGLLQLGLVLAVTGALVGVWLIAAAASGTVLVAVCTIRNLAGYTGLALLAFAALGSSAGLAVPIGYAVAVATLGSRQGGWPSWPLLGAGRVDGAAVAAVLLLAGCAATLSRAPLRSRALADLQD